MLLPDDVDFRPGGESPLARHEGFVNVDLPDRAAAPARRDTDTMDTFVDSSWYFLRYCSPDRRGRARSTPTPWRGGCRSTSTPAASSTPILHLLYSRFFTKALHDMGLVTSSSRSPR